LFVDAQTAKRIAAGKVSQYRYTGRTPLKTGHDYPVQVRGKPAVCRIHVLSGIVLPAGAVTFSDARREGYRTTTELKAAFVRRHDQRWVEKQPEDVDDSVLAARFDERYARTLVQILVFSVVTDEPLFLASQFDILHGHTDRGEYTARRGKAIDDVEVVPAAVTDVYAKAAEADAEKQRERFRNQHVAKRQGKRNDRLAMFRRAS
jgi:hypothetical protein